MTAQAEGEAPDFSAAYKKMSGCGLPLATSEMLNNLSLNRGSKPVIPKVTCIFSIDPLEATQYGTWIASNTPSMPGDALSSPFRASAAPC